MFGRRRIGMQRHMHNTGQLAGEINNDPVRGVGSQVREPVATAETSGHKVVGRFDCGRD